MSHVDTRYQQAAPYRDGYFASTGLAGDINGPYPVTAKDPCGQQRPIDATLADLDAAIRALDIAFDELAAKLTPVRDSRPAADGPESAGNQIKPGPALYSPLHQRLHEAIAAANGLCRRVQHVAGEVEL